ncbi:MAG: hypothetical protein ABSH50_05850 [Bryobacteraceae bacterium]|jgi:hypothetical protein
MKTLTSMILTVGAVALSSASGLRAQTKATADIPFAFTVQGTTLPAGSYTMSTASSGRDVMAIENVETHKQILLLAPGTESGYRRATDKNVVVFHQIGDRYFLAEVKTNAVCGHVAASKLERELTESGSPAMAAVILPALSVR